MLPNQGTTTRLGIRVKRASVKGSVERNRAKRLAKEAFRRNKNSISGGWDLIVVVNRARDASLSLFERELLILCKRAGLIRPNHGSFA